MAEDFQDTDTKGDLVKVAAYVFYAALFSGLGFLSLTAGRGIENQNTLIQYLFFFAPFFSVVLTFSIFKILKFFGLVKDIIIYIHDPELGILGEISRSLPFLKGTVHFLSSPFRLALISLFLFSTLAFIGTLNQSTIGSFFFPYTIGTIPEQVSSSSIIFFQVYNAPAENAWLYLVVTIMLSGEIMLLKKIKAIAGHARRIAILGLFFINVPAIAYIWLKIHNVVTNNTQQTFAHVFFGMMQGILLFVTGSIIPGEIYHIINNLFDYMNRSMSSLAFTITFSIILAFSFIALIAYASSRKGGLGKKGQASLLPFFNLFALAVSVLKFRIKFKKSALRRTAGIVYVIMLMLVALVFAGAGTSPFIAYIPYSIANASTNSTSVLINVSYNLTSNNTFYILNATGGVVTNTTPTSVNTSVSGDGSNAGYFFYNFTNLNNANYTFRSWMNDTSGSVTEGTVLNVVVDTFAPAIQFVANTPTNNSYLSRNSIFINTSANDAGNDHNDYSAFVDFNNSLVGYWRFEESGGTTVNDSSNYGHDGTLFRTKCLALDCDGSAGRTSAGKRGKALMVNGSATPYVNVTPTAALNINGSFTLEAWVKVKDNTAPRSWSGQIAGMYDHGDPSRRHYLVSTSGGKIDLTVYFDFACVVNSASRASTSFLQNNTWQHVIGVYDASAQTLFVYLNGVREDGTLTGTVQSSIACSTPTVPFSIGTIMYNGLPSTPFNGSIDEVKLWSRALSAQEVLASYSAGTYRLERNFTGLSDANYSYRAFVVDAAGNINSTLNQTFMVDATSPSIAFGAATELHNANLSRKWLFVNVTVSETYIKNLTIELWNSSGTGAGLGLVNRTNFSVGVADGANVTFQINFTNLPLESSGLPDDVYYFNATVFDLSGNRVVLGWRTATVDTTPPNIDFGLNSDANNSFVNRNWVFLNFSWTETRNDTFTIHNGTTNWVNVNATSNTFFYNFTSLPDGNFTFFGSVNDSAGNRNLTFNRTVVVDSVSPNVSSLYPSDSALLESATVSFLYLGNDTYLDYCSLSYSGSLVANSTSNVTGSSGSITYATDAASASWFIRCRDKAGSFTDSTSRSVAFKILGTAQSGGGAAGGGSGGGRGGETRVLTSMQTSYPEVFRVGTVSVVNVVTSDQNNKSLNAEISTSINTSNIVLQSKTALASGTYSLNFYALPDADERQDYQVVINSSLNGKTLSKLITMRVGTQASNVVTSLTSFTQQESVLPQQQGQEVLVAESNSPFTPKAFLFAVAAISVATLLGSIIYFVASGRKKNKGGLA